MIRRGRSPNPMDTTSAAIARRRSSAKALHLQGLSPIEIGNAMDVELSRVLNDLRLMGILFKDPMVLGMGISDAEGLSMLERRRAPLTPEADRAIEALIEEEAERNKALNLPPRNSVTP